jgi:hypothetical protein
MTLNEWQAKLEKHFADLQQHSSRGSHPIFALEHGLDTAELADLVHAIRFHISRTGPAERHWLAWVVYATEVGYHFSGDEYWQTFSDRTPEWAINGDRDWIRDAFRKFHKLLGGAKPYGPWAEHFNIICWPITHAIIPKDLQRQLAEVLYEIRNYFDAELLQSPERLGERIEAYSWRASSRFQELAEQHVLVGQIAASLLLTEEEESNSLILPATRRRIATDLDAERRSRDWLSDARRHATTVRLRGLGRALEKEEVENPGISLNDQENNTRRQLQELGVEPRLSLHPVGKGAWEVRLQIPNLSPLLSKFPNFRDALVNQRCSVAGSRDPRPLARSRVLFSAQEVPLGRWPQRGQVLLRFDNPPPGLDYILHTECLLRPGPQWIFRISGDQSAVEHLTQVLRPGNDYIVLGIDPIDAIPLDPELVKLACAGIQAFRISVPDSVSQPYAAKMEELGLSSARAIRVWPAGLIPAIWNDEGSAEWLQSDRPCIGLSTDFPVTNLVLNLVGPQPCHLHIPQNQIKNPLFIDIEHLEEGTHTLNLIASSEGRTTTGTLNVRIRSSRETLSLSDRANSPLRVLCTPATPTLEQLWDGRATIEVLGPDSRTVEFEVVLYRDRNCTLPLGARKFGPVKLPVSTSAFFDAFQTATAIGSVQNAYDLASACIVHVRTSTLGQKAIQCQRESVPLRWALKRENQNYVVRVVQLDEQRPIKVLHYSFDAPDQATEVRSSECLQGYRVPERGGLYFANSDAQRCSIVVPAKMHALTDLALGNNPIWRQRTESDISQLVASFEIWSMARLPGDPFARRRREQVLQRLKDKLVELLCGGDWAASERNMAADPNLPDFLIGKLSLDPRHRPLSASLRTASDEPGRLSFAAAVENLFRGLRSYVDLSAISLAHDHGVSSQQWATEFALRVFIETERVRSWAGDEFPTVLSYLLQNPIVARAARVVSLSHDLTNIAIGG